MNDKQTLITIVFGIIGIIGIVSVIEVIDGELYFKWQDTDNVQQNETTVGCGEFIPLPTMTITAHDCGEGCISQFMVIGAVSNDTNKRLNYTLPYTLKLKRDDCGLVEYIYFKPTGIYMTHIYDDNLRLIGGYESTNECSNITQTYQNITVNCEEITKEVSFLMVQEPEPYSDYEDCKKVE